MTITLNKKPSKLQNYNIPGDASGRPLRLTSSVNWVVDHGQPGKTINDSKKSLFTRFLNISSNLAISENATAFTSPLCYSAVHNNYYMKNYYYNLYYY
jgi:hypothetical protein